MAPISGPEAKEILVSIMEHQFINRNIDNTLPAYKERLEKGGQDPAYGGAGCGDSFCTTLYDTAGIRPLPNIVFTGDNPGNALVTRLYDSRKRELVLSGTSSTAYFANHVATHGQRPHYFLFSEGHTLCGAMDAILGNAYHKMEAGLYEPLLFMHEKLKDTINKLDRKGITDKIMRNALLAQTNVDIQVNLAMELYKKLYPGIIENNKLYVVGMMRDITGDIYAPETPMIGDVFITNINGEKDTDRLKQLVTGLLREYSITKEVIEHNVRRLDF